MNSNLSLIYTIYEQRNLETLQIFLIGQVGTKVVSQLFSRVIARAVITELKKRLYFMKVFNEAQEQKKSMAMYEHLSFNKDEQMEFENKRKERSNIALFAHLKDSFNEKRSYEWKRLVSIFTKNETKFISEEPLFVDQIEMQSRLYNLKTVDELREIAETFIILGYASLYSFICPIISVIVFMYTIVMSKAERHMHLKYLKRQ